MPLCEIATLHTLGLRSRAAQPFQLCTQTGIVSFQSLGAGVLRFGACSFRFRTRPLGFRTGVCAFRGLLKKISALRPMLVEHVPGEVDLQTIPVGFQRLSIVKEQLDVRSVRHF
jgi:hypothetical protein